MILEVHCRGNGVSDWITATGRQCTARCIDERAPRRHCIWIDDHNKEKPSPSSYYKVVPIFLKVEMRAFYKVSSNGKTCSAADDDGWINLYNTQYCL